MRTKKISYVSFLALLNLIHAINIVGCIIIFDTNLNLIFYNCQIVCYIPIFFFSVDRMGMYFLKFILGPISVLFTTVLGLVIPMLFFFGFDNPFALLNFPFYGFLAIYQVLQERKS